MHGQVSFKTVKLTRGWAKLRFQCLLGGFIFSWKPSHSRKKEKQWASESWEGSRRAKTQSNYRPFSSPKSHAHSRNLNRTSNLKEESSWFWYLIGSNSDQFCSSSFGIAFDIDGVVLRSEIPIGGSPQAIRRLYDDSGTLTSHAHLPFIFLFIQFGKLFCETLNLLAGNLRIPYVFLTNGEFVTC